MSHRLCISSDLSHITREKKKKSLPSKVITKTNNILVLSCAFYAIYLLAAMGLLTDNEISA